MEKQEELQLFQFENKPVRTVTINGEPYFVAKDVADILAYAEPRRAVSQHVDREDRKALSRKDWGDSCQGQHRVIITTNLTIAELHETYNAKLVSRMLAGSQGHIIDFNGIQDNRREAPDETNLSLF